MGTDYYSVCPVCMNGFKADKEQKKEIKQLLAQAPSNVHFTPHMVSYADKKTFDFYLQDDATGEKIRILQGVSKYEVKEEYKSRLIKKKTLCRKSPHCRASTQKLRILGSVSYLHNLLLSLQ